MSILILVFLPLVIVVSLFIFWLIFMVDSVTKGHDLTTNQKQIKLVCEIIGQQKVIKNFYDLGCAQGALAVKIKRRFPQLAVCAIDNDSVRIFFAKMRACFLHKKINFVCADIFKVNLSQADMIYTYLWYDIMPPLEQKLQKELKPGALVVTNTSSFPNWKPIKIIEPENRVAQKVNIETLFVYRKE